jgi:hypothetical protein
MDVSLDVARVRLDNALLLFDEFVQATVKYPDAATLRGLERRFAERLQIQPSYWSQIKNRSRQIGERLARQFERLCRKPVGWMDLPHGGLPQAMAAAPGAVAGHTQRAAAQDAPAPESLPADDDERFIVGLVLSFYRRHPQRARTQLLALLGEALMPTAPAAGPSSAANPAPAVPVPDAESLALWHSVRRQVAPLKKKR